MENKIPKVLFEEKGMGFLLTSRGAHNMYLRSDQIGEIWHYVGVLKDEHDVKHYIYVSSKYHFIGVLDIDLFTISNQIEFKVHGEAKDLFDGFLKEISF